MAGDLMIVALHDLTIEQLAVKIARRRGHRAIYQARAQAAASSTTQLSSRAGLVSLLACNGVDAATAVTVSWYDGPPATGRALFVTNMAATFYTASLIPPPGVMVVSGLYAKITTGTGGPYQLFAQWSEVCQCHLGHDHLGSMGG